MTKNVLFLIGIISLFLGSCNKGCEFPEDENKGIIVPDAIVYGGNTGGIASVHDEISGQFNLKISFDNGYSYIPMDATQFAKYTIFNFPIIAGCNSHFEREITAVGNTVTYKITVESCPDCEEEYQTDNWVLVDKSKLPSTYSVNYVKKVK